MSFGIATPLFHSFIGRPRFGVCTIVDGISIACAKMTQISPGWANLATGLKYVLIRDVENQFLLSIGFQYEWSNGSSDVFQGNGEPITKFL